jgi:hypothetical protein
MSLPFSKVQVGKSRIEEDFDTLPDGDRRCGLRCPGQRAAINPINFFALKICGHGPSFGLTGIIQGAFRPSPEDLFPVPFRRSVADQINSGHPSFAFIKRFWAAFLSWRSIIAQGSGPVNPNSFPFTSI